MPRFFFEISYRGTGYAGWQSQHNATGIQDVVEDALGKILRIQAKIVASGRTDTGVHCVQQFFHCDIEKTFEPQTLLNRLNAFLPRDIAIRSIRPVKPQAHARYSARERTYEYHITTVKDPLLIGLALPFYKPLDVPTMNRAAALLCGEHDFTSFSKVNTDVHHFRCTVKKQSGSKRVRALHLPSLPTVFTRHGARHCGHHAGCRNRKNFCAGLQKHYSAKRPQSGRSQCRCTRTLFGTRKISVIHFHHYVAHGKRTGKQRQYH